MKGADSKYICPFRKVLRKREFGRHSPFWCCPEKWSRLNRISHPHWVEICVDHNGQINLCAKQKYEVLSATNVLVYASLQHIYHVNEAVQILEGTLCDW